MVSLGDPELGGPVEHPLAGTDVVVCRSAADAGPLIDHLTSLGARPVPVPLLARSMPADGGAALAAAVNRLLAARYRWLVATSANGVEAVAAALAGRALPAGLRVAAVGPATAAAFAAAGIGVDLVPSRATAADLAASFPLAPSARHPGAVERERVLAPLAELASHDLVTGLVARGYAVDRVDAYRMIEPEVDPSVASRVARASAVLLTSPSIVDRFVDRFPASIAPVTAICIGPRTAARARQRGLTDPVVAAVHTTEGLVEALVTSLATPARSGT